MISETFWQNKTGEGNHSTFLNCAILKVTFLSNRFYDVPGFVMLKINVDLPLGLLV